MGSNGSDRVGNLEPETTGCDLSTETGFFKFDYVCKEAIEKQT